MDLGSILGHGEVKDDEIDHLKNGDYVLITASEAPKMR